MFNIETFNIETVLGLIYPKKCHFCGCGLGRDERFFCAECMAGAVAIREPRCTVCGIPFSGAGGSHECHECMRKRPPFDIAMAPAAYTGVVKEAIHLYKYDLIRHLKDYLGGFIEDGSAKWFRGYTVAAAVPLHKKRLRERGFNQSLFLAESAARALDVPLSACGLVRTRYTKPQVDLDHSQREVNVKGAFSVTRPGDFKGGRVLLVDDVYTTGATARECARALKKAGAEAVGVLTVARVV